MHGLRASSPWPSLAFLQTVQPMIFMQREVYYRERAAGMISVMPYALAQQLVEVRLEV